MTHLVNIPTSFSNRAFAFQYRYWLWWDLRALRKRWSKTLKLSSVMILLIDLLFQDAEWSLNKYLESRSNENV